MKKIKVLLLSLLLVLLSFVNISAAENHIIDSENTMSSDEINELNKQFEEVYENYDIDIYYVCDFGVGDDDINDYCAEFLDDHSRAANTVLFFVNENYFFIEDRGNAADLIEENAQTIWDVYYNSDTYYEGVYNYGCKAVELINSINYEVVTPESKELVTDLADLLSDSEEAQLTEVLKAVSAKHNIDVVVVTCDSLNGLSAQEYADDYYDYNGFNDNGVVFLVSMADRDWWVSTKGSLINGLGDAGIDYIGNTAVSYLSDGRYYDAFVTYSEIVDSYLSGETNPTPSVEKGLKPSHFGIAAAVAGVITLIVSGILNGQLKSVREEKTANKYIKEDSLNITGYGDYFIRSDVQRSRRVKDEDRGSHGGGGSSHISSSGSSHGGGGGKF